MTQAVINLSACRHNLSVAKKSAPDSKCIAVIKANAYGHGMVNIAKALTNADAFAVACIDEAIELREANITPPILLLEGFNSENELDLIRQYNLDSVIHTEEQLQLFESSTGEAINVVVKIDTGMHRLGFNPNDVLAVYQRLEKTSNVNKNIQFMTHFSSADNKQDDKTLKQIEVFYQTIDACSKVDNAFELSLANSAGILAWPQSHATWSRPGIMLYGVSPFINYSISEPIDYDLKPVMTLSSTLISIKKLKKGEAIGYGGTYVCEKDMKVGIVAIGYGDGYPRHAKTGTPVLVNGKRCSLLGRVSMDMICVDLSEQLDAKINDQVILWGEGLAVEEIAAAAETIAYELLCGVTSRVKFSYIT